MPGYDCRGQGPDALEELIRPRRPQLDVLRVQATSSQAFILFRT